MINNFLTFILTFTIVKVREKLGAATMANIRLRAHIQAMSSTMELIIIASVIALVADFCWVLHDVAENGISVAYVCIGGGLFTATVMTTWALRKHHLDIVQNGIKNLMVEKLEAQKKRNRVKRHLELVRSRQQ